MCGLFCTLTLSFSMYLSLSVYLYLSVYLSLSLSFFFVIIIRMSYLTSLHPRLFKNIAHVGSYLYFVIVFVFVFVYVFVFVLCIFVSGDGPCPQLSQNIWFDRLTEVLP